MISIAEQSGHTSYGVVELIMSSAADINNLPTNNIHAGSTAFCTENSKAYIYDGSTWEEILVAANEKLSALKNGSSTGSIQMTQVAAIEKDIPTNGKWVVRENNSLVEKTSNEVSSNSLTGYQKREQTYWKNVSGIETQTTLANIISELINNNPTASANGAVALGIGTKAFGVGAVSSGYKTEATGDYSYAGNYKTKATNVKAHAEGGGTKAIGACAHSEGDSTEAQGIGSHAEGGYTFATGNYSHAEGAGNNNNGADQKVLASGVAAHAEGFYTTASKDYSHAEGSTTVASGVAAHAEGFNTTANGNYSHAEGGQANGDSYGSKATGSCSHAEGRSTESSAEGSHSEGVKTQATQKAAHAEGRQTKAMATDAHAEGRLTTASGPASHAGGYYSVAFGDNSFAHGDHVIANANDQAIFGKYNDENYTINSSAPLFAIGNGTDANNKNTTFAIGQDGSVDINIVETKDPNTDTTTIKKTSLKTTSNGFYINSDQNIRLYADGFGGGFVFKSNSAAPTTYGIYPTHQSRNAELGSRTTPFNAFYIKGPIYKVSVTTSGGKTTYDAVEYLLVPKPEANDAGKVLTANSDGTVSWKTLGE